MIAVLILTGVGFLAPALAAAVAPAIHLTDEAQTYDLIGRADVLDDPTGNLDVDEVAQSGAFHASAENPQPPYGAVRWYRVRIVTPVASAGRWYLVAPNTCDDADLYVPRPHGFSHAAFGYRVPFAQRPSPGTPPAALVQQTNGSLFVRLQCTKSPQDLSFESSASLAASAFTLQPRYLAVILTFGLVIVAAALALVTRSRLYALASLPALAGAANVCALNLDHWLPTTSLPLISATSATLASAMIITQWLFYENFFRLGRFSRRRQLTLRVATAVCVVVCFAQEVFIPVHIYTAHLWLAPWSDLEDYVFGLWYFGVGALAVKDARSGSRSAWFVAAGALSFGLAIYTSDLSDFIGTVPAWISLAWDFALPFDIVLVIVGVGDQLRQTELSHQRTVIERDAAQSSLVTQQRAHIDDIETRNHAFARFVPREFLGQLDKGDLIDVALGDHTERSMAVLFTDVRGFTAMSERLSSEATFDVLNGYFARAGPVIRAHGGFIDKYVGDAIVALFPNRPSDALDAAIGVQSEVRRFNEERSRRGEEPIAVGIGVNYGSMLLGTVGESERFETTVIADSVNVASRLEGLTKIFGVGIIVGGALVDALENRDAYSVRPLGEVEIRGHQRRATAYELFDGDPHELVLLKRRLLDDFTTALAAYAAGDFADSAARFDAIVRTAPTDTAALHFRDRSAAMRDEGIIPGAPNTFA